MNTLPGLARRGAELCWHELPRTLAAGLLVALTAVPLVVAATAGAPGWIVALTPVPLALALTGLARFAAVVARGDAARLALLRRVDPVLAAVTAAGVALCAALFTVDGLRTAGAAGAAALLLVLPSAFAYGAVRDRSGLQALRGGLILAALRPGWALTLAALGCLGGFAVAASGGVLLPVVPALLLTIAATQTAELLDRIDEMQNRS
jgi:hypothetical protein